MAAGAVAGLGGQSFTPGTRVLLASGKAVPISQLKPGEKVRAVNTGTGKAEDKTVLAVLVHYDTDLYDLTVKTPHGHEVIHTTSHLFWDPSLNSWIPANHLKKGEHLKTPDGQNAVADGGSVPADHDGWMWDLTVQDDHDFYVLPGGNDSHAAYYLVDKDGVTAVLVHNVNGPQCSGQLPLFVLRDGEVASSTQMAASKGGPTAGQTVPGGLRDEMISQAAANGDGTYQCWRCGMTTTNPDNVQIGHVNVPRSQGVTWNRSTSV